MSSVLVLGGSTQGHAGCVCTGAGWGTAAMCRCGAYQSATATEREEHIWFRLRRSGSSYGDCAPRGVEGEEATAARGATLWTTGRGGERGREGGKKRHRGRAGSRDVRVVATGTHDAVWTGDARALLRRRKAARRCCRASRAAERGPPQRATAPLLCTGEAQRRIAPPPPPAGDTPPSIPSTASSEAQRTSQPKRRRGGVTVSAAQGAAIAGPVKNHLAARPTPWGKRGASPLSPPSLFPPPNPPARPSAHRPQALQAPGHKSPRGAHEGRRSRGAPLHAREVREKSGAKKSSGAGWGSLAPSHPPQTNARRTPPAYTQEEGGPPPPPPKGPPDRR